MRYFAALLALVAVSVGGFRLWLSMQAPEDRIRWSIEDAADAFNEKRLGPCLDLFGRGYSDENTGFGRDEVRQVLVAAFFQQVDPVTKEFDLEVVIHELDVSVEGEAATASFVAELFRLSKASSEPEWSFRLEGDLEDGDEGWRFVRTRFRTLSGTIPH